MRNRLLHYPCRFNHLRQEHLTGAKQVADDVHAVHQRPLYHLDRPRKLLPALLGIVDDVCVDPLHERIFEPLGHRQAAPLRRLLFRHRVGAAIFFGERDEPVARLGIAVKDNVLARDT